MPFGGNFKTCSALVCLLLNAFPEIHAQREQEVQVYNICSLARKGEWSQIKPLAEMWSLIRNIHVVQVEDRMGANKGIIIVKEIRDTEDKVQAEPWDVREGAPPAEGWPVKVQILLRGAD